MSKFHFRLAALLRVRETARDRRRVELAEAERIDVELRGRLAHLAGRREQCQGECREAAGAGPVDLRRLIAAQRHADSLRCRELRLCEQRQSLAEEIQWRRQTLVEADRQVRVLEKLREKQRETHRQEMERQEAKRLDEAALRAAALRAG